MTDKKYSRVGSRIVLKTLTPLSGSDEEDIFLSESIADRPELRVQLRYFIVELTPSRRLVRKDGGKCKPPTINITTNSRNAKKKTEAKAPASEAASCESFHSCRSTTSMQDVKGNSNEVCSKQTNCVVRKTIRDDDLLNNLTMVNAIFLGNSVSEQVKRVQRPQDKVDEKSVPRTASSSNKPCTETYTCQVNHNPKVRYIDRVTGNDPKTLYVANDFGCYDGKKRKEKLSYSREFSDSFEPVSNMKSKNEIVSSNMRNDSSIPSSRFEKNALSTSSVSVFRKVEERVCKMKFSEVPLSERKSISSTLEKSCTDWTQETNQRRRRIVVPGCEEHSETPRRSLSVRLVCCSDESLKLTSPNASSSMVYVENADNASDPVNVFQGDGDFSDFQNVEISSRVLRKQQVNSFDDNFLRTLIRKSIKKLRFESENSLTVTGLNECDIFDPSQERAIHEKKSASLTEMDWTQESVVIEERESSKSLNVSGWDKLKVNEEDIHKEILDLTHVGDIESFHQKQGINANISESSKRDDTFGNGLFKRAICDRTRTTGLPVIQEESAEEVLNERQDSREDNLDDDYCLIDSSGKPIHLFDSKGLPLTDNNGRPLKSAKGKLLLSCDQNGIPVVDSDSPIFDMMGRQPHEDGFDPAAAPQAAGGRLTAGDGRPLLLFDVEGRPLTTRSGTMLLDARGHGLVQLTPTLT